MAKSSKPATRTFPSWKAAASDASRKAASGQISKSENARIQKQAASKGTSRKAR